MTDVVFISDREGRLVYINDAFVTFHRFASRAQTLRSLEQYPELFRIP